MSRLHRGAMHDNAGIAAWKFKLRTEIDSYEDCMTFLMELGDTSIVARDLGPHMIVRREIGYIAVVLYDTEIIRYYPDGAFSVDNGGFATPTTMYRLNAVLPPEYHAYHHRRQLALHHGSERVLWPATHGTRVNIDTGEIIT